MYRLHGLQSKYNPYNNLEDILSDYEEITNAILI